MTTLLRWSSYMPRLRRGRAGHRALQAATERRRCRCLAALMVSKRSWLQWRLRERRLVRLRPAWLLQDTAPRFPPTLATRTSHLNFDPSTRMASAMKIAVNMTLHISRMYALAELGSSNGVWKAIVKLLTMIHAKMNHSNFWLDRIW